MDLGTKALGNNYNGYSVCGIYSPELRAEISIVLG